MRNAQPPNQQKKKVPTQVTTRRALILHTGAALLVLGLSIMSSQAAAPAAAQGFVTGKGFLNIGGGTAVADLTGNAKFPDNADVTYYYPYFEWNASADGDINTAANNAYADSYGAQMVGYFYPPVTGDYVFFLASDDNSNLYLSTDDSPTNKKLIAQEAGWSNARSWETIGSGSTVEAKNSSTFAGTQWPNKDSANGGAKITLQANKAYYIEALMKEGNGGDNLAVAVRDPNGSIDSTLPIPGKYLATIDKTTGPLKIVTQPASQTINQGNPVTFSIVVDGTPPYTYEWRKNGTAITGATSPSYTIDRVAAADNNAKFSVAVTGGQGAATSTDAILTVNSDTTAPTVMETAGSVTFDSVTVVFSEPMNPTTAEKASNYSLSGGLTISAAKLAAAAGSAGDNKVILSTSKQAEGGAYTLTINGVTDTAGNTVAANTKADVKAFLFAQGVVLQKNWDNVTQNNIAGLTNDVRFPDAPTFTTVEPRWEYGPDGSNESGTSYGNQLVGWFIPAKSGSYIFFTCSDDPSVLYLSTDDNPINKRLIAQETSWSSARNWVSVGSGTVEEKRSDSFSASEWPTPNSITLQAGKRYYMESLHTEGSGGDNVGATFIMSGDPDPVNLDPPALTGALIGTYMDPAGASIIISQQPQAASTVANATATFSVVATGTSKYGTNLVYQWQKAAAGSTNFTDIADARSASYTTPFLAAANNGEKYRVAIYRAPISQNSAEALLTVSTDTVAPTITSIDPNPSQVALIVHFSEPLDSASATTASNYSINNGITVSSAVLTNQQNVVLTTSQQTGGSEYTITVKNVKDLAGNAVAANTASTFKAATVATGVVAYWNFDGDFKDWVKDFDGTARGSTPIAFVDGKAGFGKAILLDGSDQFVEITGGNDNELEFPGGSMSIAGWFTVNTFDTSWQALVAKGESSNWRVARNNATSGMSYAGGLTDVLGTVDVTDGNWHHFVAISDATGANFGTALYIDGKIDSTIEGNAALTANTAHVMIGENPEARSREWNGKIDDMAIWNRVLLEPEIAQLYAGGAGKPLGSFLPPPTSESPTLKVSWSATTLTIQWTPTGGTLESSPTLGPTAKWTSVGAANPAAIPIGPGNAYYRVRN